MLENVVAIKRGPRLLYLSNCPTGFTADHAPVIKDLAGRVNGDSGHMVFVGGTVEFRKHPDNLSVPADHAWYYVPETDERRPRRKVESRSERDRRVRVQRLDPDKAVITVRRVNDASPLARAWGVDTRPCRRRKR